MPRGNVQYTLEGSSEEPLWLDEESRTRSNVGPFENRMKQIVGDPKHHNTWRKVAIYETPDRARQSVQSLRKRFGYGPEAYGWMFRAARDGEEGQSGAVWLAYQPEKITKSGVADHEALIESRKRPRDGS